MGFFSGDKGELTPEEREALSPEERIRFLEERVEILSKFEGNLFDATFFALSRIHAIVEVLKGKGIVEASELEEMRVKTLEALKRLEKAKGNGG